MPKSEPDEVPQGTDHLERLFSAFAFYMDRQKEERTRRVIIGLSFELSGIPERDLDKLEQDEERLEMTFNTDRPKEEEWERSVDIAGTTMEFFTDKRHYIIIDAPGHRDSIKNMIASESQADVAITMVSADGNSTTEIAKGNHKAEEIQRQMRQRSRLINLIKEMQFYIGGNKMENMREWCEVISLITVPKINGIFSFVCRMRFTTEVKVETRKLCNSEKRDAQCHLEFFPPVHEQL